MLNKYHEMKLPNITIDLKSKNLVFNNIFTDLNTNKNVNVIILALYNGIFSVKINLIAL